MVTNKKNSRRARCPTSNRRLRVSSVCEGKERGSIANTSSRIHQENNKDAGSTAQDLALPDAYRMLDELVT
jgi:hypothetical protein